MNKVIWKYKLHMDDIQTIKMPIFSEILSCQIQGNDVCLWALVDPELENKERVIEIIGTGNPVIETFNVRRVFIDTVQLHGGSLILHVFERVLK